MPSHEIQLERAIAVAQSSRDRGNHPFGALLADAAGTVVLTAENTVVSSRDVTGHAETNLVRMASAAFSSAELNEFTLYASTAPCAMCAGAIYWAGIGAVVYALAEAELYAMTGDHSANPTLLLPCRQVFAAGSRAIEVTGPFDMDAARDVHDGFWTMSRSLSR